MWRQDRGRQAPARSCCSTPPSIRRLAVQSVTVRGGPGALTKAIADAAREAGAEIRVGADVSRILVNDGTAVGVLLRRRLGDRSRCGDLQRGPEADVSPAHRSGGARAGVPDEDPQLPLPWHGRESQPGARLAADVSGNDGGRSPRTHSDRSVHRLSRARLRSFQVRRDLRASPTSRSPSRRSWIPLSHHPAGT